MPAKSGHFSVRRPVCWMVVGVPSVYVVHYFIRMTSQGQRSAHVRWLHCFVQAVVGPQTVGYNHTPGQLLS